MVRYVAEVTLGPQQDRLQAGEYHGDAALPPAFSEDPLFFLDPAEKLPVNL
jgi:hypothetical protein